MSKHHRDPQRRAKRDEFASDRNSNRGYRGVSWKALLVAAGLVLVAAVLFATRGGRTGADAFTSVGDRGGDLSFPLNDFADGEAHFYRYVTAAGKDIRFFVMRSSNGVTRAAFDTCDVCYRERRGYHKSGDSMICNNCGQAFRSTEINEVRSGCNPAPLDRAIQGDRMVLRAAALEHGALYF